MVIVMQVKKKLVFGVGINDADYAVKPSVNRVRGCCPFYRKWVEMLRRCYSADLHTKRPTYIGCSTCEEWLTFSNFRAWMIKQDWEGKALDKDLLITGNKLYSPDTCLLVSREVNNFMTDCAASRGKFPIGVAWNKSPKMFEASCQNPFTKKSEYLGIFHCPNKAHLAWKKRKHEHACKLADLQTDNRIANALRARYL